jgi:hypothetical protein
MDIRLHKAGNQLELVMRKNHNPHLHQLCFPAKKPLSTCQVDFCIAVVKLCRWRTAAEESPSLAKYRHPDERLFSGV